MIQCQNIDNNKKIKIHKEPLLQNINKNKTTKKFIYVHKYISLIFSLNISGLLSLNI